jgi:hypothetical protein
LDDHSFPIDTPTESFYNARQIIAAMNTPNFIESAKSLSESSELTRSWLLDTLEVARELDYQSSAPDSPMDVADTREAELGDEEDRSPPAKRARQVVSTPMAGPSQPSPFYYPAALPFDNVSSISRTTSQAEASQASGVVSSSGAMPAPSQAAKSSKRKRSSKK